MLLARFHVCVLQAVITTHSLRNTGAFEQVRRNIGSMMCRAYCRQFVHFTDCVFLAGSLVCKATWYQYRAHAHEGEIEYLDVNKDGDGAFFPGRTQCPDRYSRILRTRTSNHLCVKLHIRAVKREKMTRLLVAPLKLNWEIPFIEMHLENNSTQYHPYLKATSVTAIAYIPSSHRVLIALHQKRCIQSCSLDKNDCFTIRNQTRAKYIEVDDALNLVFLTTETPSYLLSRMTPDGRHFRYISRQIGNPCAICLETTERIVYVSNFMDIKIFSYDGEVRGVLKSVRKALVLALDENVLYFGRFRSIHNIHRPFSSVSDSNILTYTDYTPHNIVQYGEQLYVSYTRIGMNIISVIYPNRLSKRQMIGSRRQGNVITLIP